MKKLLFLAGVFCFLIALMYGCTKEEPQEKGQPGASSGVVKEQNYKSAAEDAVEGVKESSATAMEKARETADMVKEKTEKMIESTEDKATEAYEEGEKTVKGLLD